MKGNKWWLISVVLILCFPSKAMAVSIQSQIDSASSGETVIVKSGTYNERLNISKPLKVLCEQARTCVIKGATLTGKVVLDGFYSLNSDTNAGAIVMNGSGNVARNNKIEGACMVGINLNGSDNLAENNEILKSRQCAGSSGPDADGIRYFGSNQTMRGNYIHDIFFDPVVNKTPHIDCFQTWGGAKNAIIENNVCDNFSANVNSTESTQGANLEDDQGAIFRNNYFRTHGKKIMVETSSSNTVIVDNIFVGGALIEGAPSQYGIFGSGTNITGNNNIFYNINIKNGTSVLLGVKSPVGNMLNTDPKLDKNRHPLPGSPACKNGGGYIGAFPCISGNQIVTGDVNSDGVVNLVDFSIWKGEYLGKMLTTKSDLNNSNSIDLVDFSIWKTAYLSR